MKELKIEQNESLIENVSSSVIDKLYRCALESKVADESNDFEMSLSGNLQAPSAYEDAVLFLTAKFPKLHITIPNNNYYIRFADPKFEEICLNNFSADKVGVTKTDLNKVSEITNQFADIDINTLADFQYLTATAITIKQNYGFYYCNNFTDQIKKKYGESAYNSANRQNPIVIHPEGVDIVFPKSNIYIEGQGSALGSNDYRVRLKVNSVNLNGCTITPINNTYGQSFLYIGCEFEWNDNLVPNQTSFNKLSLFTACKIDKVIFREGITYIADYFQGSYIPYIVYPSTIEYIMDFSNFRRDATGMNEVGAIVFKSVNPPDNPYNNNTIYWNRPSAIYVPDSSVNKYKNEGSGIWTVQTVKNLITPMSQMPKSLQEELGITDEDINRTE